MKEIIIDTETTGLDIDDEIVEICVIDLSGEILLNTLIKPSKPINLRASEIHNIYDKDVENSPIWSEVYKQFLDIIKDSDIYIYNSEFDTRIINQTSQVYDLDEIDFEKCFCVMHEYAEIWGDFHDYFQSYTWQSLSNAAKQQSIDITDLNTHRAYDDCEITRRLLLKIANDECIEKTKKRVF